MTHPRGDLPAMLQNCLTKREKVLFASRRHWSWLLEPVLTPLAVSVVAMWHGVANPDQPMITRLLLACWVALLIRFGWRLWLWRRHWFVVTDLRFLLQHGRITLTLAQLAIIHGRDLTLHQSPLGQWFDYGDFTLETAPRDHVLRTVSCIPDGPRLYRRISGAVLADESGDALLYGFGGQTGVLVEGQRHGHPRGKAGGLLRGVRSRWTSRGTKRKDRPDRHRPNRADRPNLAVRDAAVADQKVPPTTTGARHSARHEPPPKANRADEPGDDVYDYTRDWYSTREAADSAPVG